MGFLREPSHILIILLVVVILFGSSRLPGVARNMSRSMRIFKSEVKQMKNDDTPADKAKADARPESPIEGRVLRDEDDTQTRAHEARRDA